MENVRNVDAVVSANDAILNGVLEIEIQSNAYLAADRFRLKVALESNALEVWSNPVIEVKIKLTVNQDSMTSITGLVDRIIMDPIDKVVVVEGRDLIALFISSKLDQSFDNLTASEVVTALALKHALTPNVFPTPDFVGRFFQSDYTQNSLSQYAGATTEWDLIVQLAHQFGYDAWVEGVAFFFQPNFAESGSSPVLYANDCLALRLEKNVELSSGLIVTVNSWNCAEQIAVSQSVGFGSQQYSIIRANLSDTTALLLATNIWIEMMQHERNVEFLMPGEVFLKPRATFFLNGTGTEFDDLFSISEISRHFSFRNGYTQDVVARRPAWMISSTL